MTENMVVKMATITAMPGLNGEKLGLPLGKGGGDGGGGEGNGPFPVAISPIPPSRPASKAAY